MWQKSFPNRPFVVFIVGPTAAGKTRIAIKVTEIINAQIISADSMQSYKGMNIITQKPTHFQRRLVKHHLVDFLDPREEYSAAMFARLAENKIETIFKSGRIPIVAGGSGLYIKALIDGIFPSRGKETGIRNFLEGLAMSKGVYFLHNRLKKFDPEAAKKIHPHDVKRVIRALEIYDTEKITKTELIKKTAGIGSRYNVIIFGVIMDRKMLYRRIEQRVDRMMKEGLVEEVKSLLKHGLGPTSRAAIGIKQIEGYLHGRYSLEHAISLIKKDTRRFAKRQLVWFRADKRVIWLDIGQLGEDGVVGRIVGFIKKTMTE